MDAWWHEVWLTLVAEFADITDAKQITQITVRLLMAALLGGILGFEREQQGKAAGVRTTCWLPWVRPCLSWCRKCPAPRPMP